MRLAIADPPYPPHFSERHDLADGGARITTRSRARRWYGDGPRDRGSRNQPADFHPDAGEWDDPARHRQLLEQLADEFDGWAIATCSDGLHHYGQLPIPTRVMAWVKPRAMPTAHRITNGWEPVILYPPVGRRARAGAQVPDVLTAAAPAIGFPGAKPTAWTEWVLDAMGFDPDLDTVTDLFPGSGSVSRVIEARRGGSALHQVEA